MKTWEMYRTVLLNPKAKFKGISEGLNKGKTFEISPNDLLREEIKDGCHACIPGVNEDWELVENPVDFITALNSGLNIRCEEDQGYVGIDFYLSGRVLTKEILNGKWYIE